MVTHRICIKYHEEKVKVTWEFLENEMLSLAGVSFFKIPHRILGIVSGP